MVELPPLTPIYVEDGPITVVIDDGALSVRRGSAVVQWPEPVVTLPMVGFERLHEWRPWLRKARLATLRALVKYGGMVAGDGGGMLTAPVQSQLRRAGLLKRSNLWGFDLSAARGLRGWARIELALREAKTLATADDTDPTHTAAAPCAEES